MKEAVQSECNHFLPQCPQIINQLSLCTGIKLNQWETVQDSGVKAYEVDKKCIV
jgi:hypothetical protein